ncbi:MAG: site-specific integrase [Sandaracinaceae bacterium]|nr:site-specific integrase [Sandaracinaceae bacterium]
MADDPTAEGALALAASASAELALREALAHARAFAHAARSERTRDAYRYQWARFEVRCEAHALVPLPASRVWATEGVAVATLAQALAAIGEAHRAMGHPPLRSAPELREVWKGIRRTLGAAPRRVAPLVVAELRQLGGVLAPDSRIGRRDRALLMVGFAAALRRSEIVALDVPDLDFTADGLEVWLGRSKTDQEGQGARVGVPFGSDRATCPVRALRAWLEDAGLADGAVFRSVSRHGRLGGRLSDRDVARIVQRTALRAGLDPARYAGHSLRAGLATSAAKAGKRDRAIMKQGRWRSRAMVDRYVRDATLLDDNAAAGIGL